MNAGFHTKIVIARFMRATQFVSSAKKMGCPDKPGNDDRIKGAASRHG